MQGALTTSDIVIIVIVSAMVGMAISLLFSSMTRR